MPREAEFTELAIRATVRHATGCPRRVSSAAMVRVDLLVHFNELIGSPAVVSSTMRRSCRWMRSTRSFLDEKLKPIGACPGYSIARLFLPWHLIPAPFFDGFSSLPAT